MRTSKELKKEWLRFSGLDTSADDRWVRDNIAALFDVKQPSEAQERLLSMADMRLSLMDRPSAAWPNHKQELMALALAEFGPRTFFGVPRKLLKAVFHIIALAVGAMLFRLIK
jgi:hypothetical protein